MRALRLAALALCVANAAVVTALAGFCVWWALRPDPPCRWVSMHQMECDYR